MQLVVLMYLEKQDIRYKTEEFRQFTAEAGQYEGQAERQDAHENCPNRRGHA